MIPIQLSQYHVSRIHQHLHIIAAQDFCITGYSRIQETLKRICDTFKWIAVYQLVGSPSLRVVYSCLPLPLHLFPPDNPLPFKAYSTLQTSQEAWGCLHVVECFNQERLQALMYHVVSSAEPHGKKAGRRDVLLFQT